MYTKHQKVNIDDTRFIFTTNFSGDSSRDRFGSDKRRVNVVIPTMDLGESPHGSRCEGSSDQSES